LEEVVVVVVVVVSQEFLRHQNEVSLEMVLHSPYFEPSNGQNI
jgi:hypothetical protein